MNRLFRLVLHIAFFTVACSKLYSMRCTTEFLAVCQRADNGFKYHNGCQVCICVHGSGQCEVANCKKKFPNKKQALKYKNAYCSMIRLKNIKRLKRFRKKNKIKHLEYLLDKGLLSSKEVKHLKKSKLDKIRSYLHKKLRKMKPNKRKLMVRRIRKFSQKNLNLLMKVVWSKIKQQERKFKQLKRKREHEKLTEIRNRKKQQKLLHTILSKVKESLYKNPVQMLPILRRPPPRPRHFRKLPRRNHHRKIYEPIPHRIMRHKRKNRRRKPMRFLKRHSKLRKPRNRQRKERKLRLSHGRNRRHKFEGKDSHWQMDDSREFRGDFYDKLLNNLPKLDLEENEFGNYIK